LEAFFRRRQRARDLGNLRISPRAPLHYNIFFILRIGIRNVLERAILQQLVSGIIFGGADAQQLVCVLGRNMRVRIFGNSWIALVDYEITRNAFANGWFIAGDANPVHWNRLLPVRWHVNRLSFWTGIMLILTAARFQNHGRHEATNWLIG